VFPKWLANNNFPGKLEKGSFWRFNSLKISPKEVLVKNNNGLRKGIAKE